MSNVMDNHSNIERNIGGGSARNFNQKKVFSEGLADNFNQEKVFGEGLASNFNQEKVFGEGLASNFNQEKVFGEGSRRILLFRKMCKQWANPLGLLPLGNRKR